MVYEILSKAEEDTALRVEAWNTRMEDEGQLLRWVKHEVAGARAVRV